MGEYNKTTLCAREKVNTLLRFTNMERKHITEEEKRQSEKVGQALKTDGNDLAMQIFLLLNDYFCGIFEKNTKGILMRLENGQAFQLSIAEVVC